MTRNTLSTAAVCLLSLAAGVLPARAEDFALGGTVIAPSRVLKHGWVVIHDGYIAKVSKERPYGGGVHLLETGGLIFPGFIDLHNHPMYSVFKHWTGHKVFANRYQWRADDAYKAAVGTPGSELQRKDDQTFCDLDENAEVMALIGGTTSLTGISGRRTGVPVPSCVAGLVRNLDWASGFYGSEVGKERIRNALGVSPADLTGDDAALDRQALSDGSLDLLLIHVAEGSPKQPSPTEPKDLETSLEFMVLEQRGFLRPHVAVIHGTGFGEGDFRAMHAAGMPLIWSPRSNMELYGVTTDIAAAMKEHVTIALAPDWAPTGSSNMLGEIGYASRYSRSQLAGALTDEQLFEMATSIPARIAGIDDKVGQITSGLYADIFVLRGDAHRPFVSLAGANPGDVQLVLIGGRPVYGTPELLARLNVATESLEVCGRAMALNRTELPDGPLVRARDRLKADLDHYHLPLAPLAECP